MYTQENICIRSFASQWSSLSLNICHFALASSNLFRAVKLLGKLTNIRIVLSKRGGAPQNEPTHRLKVRDVIRYRDKFICYAVPLLRVACGLYVWEGEAAFVRCVVFDFQFTEFLLCLVCSTVLQYPVQSCTGLMSAGRKQIVTIVRTFAIILVLFLPMACVCRSFT